MWCRRIISVLCVMILAFHAADGLAAYTVDGHTADIRKAPTPNSLLSFESGSSDEPVRSEDFLSWLNLNAPRPDEDYTALLKSVSTHGLLPGTLNRERAAVLLSHAAGLSPSLQGDSRTESDRSLASPSLLPYLEEAVSAGALPLKDGLLRPFDAVTNAEADDALAWVMAMRGPGDDAREMQEISSLFSAQISPGKDPAIPILVYHAITTDPYRAKINPLYVTETAFEEQMRKIAEYGYTPVFVSELDKALPEKPIVVTFDDGYLDNYTLAFPILRKHGIKATIFVISSMPGRPNFFTWEMAGEMLDSGLVDIQTHTYDMHFGIGLRKTQGTSTAAHTAVLKADADMSDSTFMDNLGYTPTAISYPFGSYDKNVLKIYKNRYRIGVSTNNGVASSKSNRQILPRMRAVEETVIQSVYK